MSEGTGIEMERVEAENIAIRVAGLRKSFKATEVLKGVDFEARRGDIFAMRVYRRA
jgi:ABC-type histidine transport system ATPase subunit